MAREGAWTTRTIFDEPSPAFKSYYSVTRRGPHRRVVHQGERGRRRDRRRDLRQVSGPSADRNFSCNFPRDLEQVYDRPEQSKL